MNIKSILLAAGRRMQTRIRIRGLRKILRHGEDLHVGARTKIWAPKSITMGNCVYVGKDVLIEANCRIGDYCLIANRVAIIGRHDHDFSAVGFPMRFTPWIDSRRFPSPYRDEEAVVEDDVWLGYGTIVLTGVVIGRGSVVAAGSVVTKSIPPYSIAAGTPARVIGSRFADPEIISRHEAAIKNGTFAVSERGYDDHLIQPFFPE